MERYDYMKHMTEDAKEAIRDYYPDELTPEAYNREEIEEKANEELWTADSVTGNGSGSYWFNAWKAEEAICHNLDLLGEALAEFDAGPEYLVKNGPEAADVTIRCYLLGQAISAALDEIEEENGLNE